MTTDELVSSNERMSDEKRAGTGLKIAVYVLLLSSGVLGAVASMSKYVLTDPYGAGHLIGSLIAPFILCAIVVGLFSISKSNRNPHTRYRIAMGFSLLFLLSQSISAMKAISEKGKTDLVTVTAPKTVALTPTDVETIRAKATQFEQMVPSGDISTFHEMLDVDALMARAADGLTISPKFMTGVRDRMQSNGLLAPLFGPLTAIIGEGRGSYTLLRVAEANNAATALFRVKMDGGLNYHEWLFQKNEEGTVSIVDLRMFTTGELISETVRRNSLVPFISNLKGPEAKALVKTYEAGKQINTYVLQKAYDQARAVYNGLSEAEQNHKSILLAYLNAAQNLGDDAYIEAMERFIRQYPNDPAQDIIAMDYHLLKKDFERAHASIDHLDSLVKDPYLNTLRANIYLMSEEFEKAEAAASEAVKKGEHGPETYWALLSCLVNQKKYDEALAIVKVIDEKFEEQIDPDVDDAAFQEFIETKAYRAWLKSLPRDDTPEAAPQDKRA